MYVQIRNKKNELKKKNVYVYKIICNQKIEQKITYYYTF